MTYVLATAEFEHFYYFCRFGLHANNIVDHDIYDSSVKRFTTKDDAQKFLDGNPSLSSFYIVRFD